MHLDPLPSQASWRHVAARDGFEVVWPLTVGDTHRLRGATTGVEEATGWHVSYDVDLDADWGTRVVVVRAAGRDGSGEVLLEREDGDRWSVDGVHRPDLDGLVDVDLEASVVTNTLPLHRLDLVPGVVARAEAVFVRLDLRVERLVQTYELIERTDDRVVVAYSAPTFETACTLTFDAAGLVVDYPGLASRHG